jgi:hypothetical protein
VPFAQKLSKNANLQKPHYIEKRIFECFQFLPHSVEIQEFQNLKKLGSSVQRFS